MTCRCCGREFHATDVEVDELCRAVERLVRAVGERTGRLRVTRDRTLPDPVSRELAELLEAS